MGEGIPYLSFGLWPHQMVLCKSRWPEVGKLVGWCFSVCEMIALSNSVMLVGSTALTCEYMALLELVVFVTLSSCTFHSPFSLLL